jgi:hypothetical protein
VDHIIKAFKKIGVSHSVFASLLMRSWQLIAGAITLFLVSIYLTNIEQGYFYTFNSVIGLQVIFEMGLSFVILQYTGHFFSRMSWLEYGAVQGPYNEVLNFKAFLYMACRWYAIVALLILVMLIPLGIVFFQTQSHLYSTVSWKWPWVALVFFTAVNLINLPLLAVIEGGGFVSEVNHFKLIQGILGSLLSWFLLWIKVGLWFAFVPVLIGFFFSQFWLWRQFPQLLGYAIKLCNEGVENRFSWIKDVWPMQWRIAVSWISGYFIFQLYSPVLFYYSGPVEAGKMGMSIAIANILTSVGFVWMQANTPQLTKLAAKEKWVSFDKAFFKYFFQSGVFVVFGIFVIMCGFYLLKDTVYASRVISPSLMFLLLIAFAISHIISGLAYYLRLHKREPFMWLSLIGAFILTFGILFFGRKYGSTGMIYTVLITNLLYGLPTSLWLWNKLRNSWHS